MANETEKSMKDTEAASAVANTSAGMSRRALLRGAAPAIVTLYSGAALAQSSNLISATQNAMAQDSKYRCLDTSSVYSTTKPNMYDLGATPMGHVTQIRSTRQYYPTSTWGTSPTGPQATAPQMCANGGNYVRKEYWGYTRVKVSRGVLVSATALNSFADKVTYTNI